VRVALFQLFDAGRLESTVLQPYAAGLEAVWDALDQQSHDKLASFYLVAGSEEAEMLGRSLKALPEGPRREVLCGKLKEGQQAALGQLNELSRAMGEWDAVATFTWLVSASDPPGSSSLKRLKSSYSSSSANSEILSKNPLKKSSSMTSLCIYIYVCMCI